MTPRPKNFHIFLGGHDLEMLTIGELAREMLGADRVHDARLGWGAAASAYSDDIQRVITAGDRPALVELADDLPANVSRDGLIFIDHHGLRAGRETPSALRQVFDLLALPESRWTRRLALVAGNDVGHVAALRALGATAREVRAIRDADRAAQGVTAADETAARDGIARARVTGRLLVVTVASSHASPVADFLEQEYGGSAPNALLVLSPGEANFFGPGHTVLELGRAPGSWFGGALPERGFWGRALADPGDGRRVEHFIVQALDRDDMSC